MIARDAVPSAAPAARDGVVAVLTAAGSGTRLGSPLPKALVEVGGRSIVQRAAQGLVDSGVVGLVVVTAPAEHLDAFRREVTGLDLPDGVEVAVVAGSTLSRQASVAAGLEAALARRPRAVTVLVHDAARALTPPEVVRRVVRAVACGYGAVVPVVPVTDTVKEVEALTAAAPTGGADGSGRPCGGGAAGVEQVVATPDRSRLRAVQTPQGFATEVLVRAHAHGAARRGDERLAASDDAGLVEADGGQVVTVSGDPLALKITRPLDLALAEAVLAAC